MGDSNRPGGPEATRRVETDKSGTAEPTAMPGPAFLRGDRIDLHTIEAEDAEFLQEAINDRRVWNGLGLRQPITRSQEEEWIDELGEGDDVNLLVCDDGDPVGTVGLNGFGGTAGSAEVGYWMHPDFHGNGYATAAVELLVGYGFDERRLHRVMAKVFDFNDASKRVLEKVGFVEEGVKREAAFVGGEYVDVVLYGLLEDEWREREEK